AMNIYQNTFISGGNRQADMALLSSTKAGHQRRVFNNILVHTDRLPALPNLSNNVVEDGNLYWSPQISPKDANLFKKFRASALFDESKKLYPPGSTSHSLVANPGFAQWTSDGPNEYRLQKISLAVGAGVELPADWSDPLRAEGKGRPDIGALPL